MANKMSAEAAKVLEHDVKTIFRLAKRKCGVRADEICEMLRIPPHFMGYRYRRAMRAAQEAGLFMEGQGRTALWRARRIP